MKKVFLVVLMVAFFLIPQMAVADTVTTVGNYGPYQTGQGGEFTLLPDADLSYLLAGYSPLTSNILTSGTFQTFCIEQNEYIYPLVSQR